VYPVLPQWMLLVQGVLSVLLPWSTLMLMRLPTTAQCGVVLAVAAAAVAVQAQLSTAYSLPQPFHPALAHLTHSATAPLDATAHAATLMPLVRALVPLGLYGWQGETQRRSRRFGQREHKRPAGVLGTAWRCAGCGSRGSPTHPLARRELAC
jgi:hypothetical protein